MKKRFCLLSAVMVFIMTFTLSFSAYAFKWPWEKDEKVGNVREETTGPIKIGFMGNLSSPFSLSSKGAAQMAVDEINAAGGILGKQVELIIEDTKGEIPKCVEIYKKLVIVDKVLAVVIAEKVEMSAAGMEIGAELFPEYPHLFFSTIGSGDVIWQRVRDNYGKYKFGFQTYYAISTHYLQIFSGMFTDIYKNTMGIKKVALIYEDMEWTKPLREGIPGVSPRLAEVYKQAGLDVVYETTLSLDQKMFNSVFEEVAASGAEVIDCVIGYIDEASFIKQWEQSSARNTQWIIWGGLAGMPPIWNMTGGKVLGGMVGSSMVAVDITPKTIPFMTNLYTKYKVGPIFGSHTTYDTLYGFKKALETGKTLTNIDTMIQNLETVEEVAVLGTIGWDPKNHYNLPSPKYVTPIVQWKADGKMYVVYPKEYQQKPYESPVDIRK